MLKVEGRKLKATNPYNIAGTDCSAMVAYWYWNGSLVAYLLSADPTGMLRDCTVSMSTVRPLFEHCLTTV
jgi:hypothetical protein